MLKKTLLSLAIAASTAGLTACNISSTDGNNDVNSRGEIAGSEGNEGATTPVFSAGNSLFPVNIDLLFASASATDGTASVDDTSPPVTTMINDLAGFSATATIDVAFTAPLDESSVAVGSSVWLIELKSKEDNSLIDSLDLNTIVAAFPANPFADGSDQLVPGVDYTAEYVEMDGGATPTIRIHPLKPLDPKTKYIVAFTDKLVDEQGNAVARSAEYELLLGDLELASPAFVPVRGAVQGWQQLAAGFLAQATANAQKQENIVLTYAFTTEANDDILLSMAAPENYIFGLFADTAGLESAVGEETVLAVATGVAAALNAGNAANPAWVTLDPTTAAGLYATRNTDTYKTALANSVAEQLVATAPGQGQGTVDALKARYPDPADYAEAIQGAAANGAGGLLKDAAHRPEAQDFVAIPGVTIPHGPTPAQGGLGLPNPNAASMQGMLTLPQFMAKKSDDAGSFWKGSSSVGGVIDAAFSNPAATTPPKDDDGTLNVTYRFPFAQYVEDVKVPVLVTYPTAAGCTKPWKTIIFQHGITSDRTGSLGVANAMAAAPGCFATVAMDLPTHGVDADGGAGRYSAFNTFNVAGYVDADDPTKTPFAAAVAGASGPGETFEGLTERHENLALNALQEPVPMSFVEGAESGNSGDFFINLTNMQQTRDHIRQAVMDIMNLNASIGGMDIDGDNIADLDADNLHFVGHSLGAISGLTAVAVNNTIAKNPAIAVKELKVFKTAVLANPGGQLPKLLENSPSFSAQILPGLAVAAGLTQGMADLEKFFGVFQAPLDSVDPVNFTNLLMASDTPVLMFEMIGGGEVPGGNGAIYPSDTVVPNNANPALDDVPTGKSYLTGTDPLVNQLELATVTASISQGQDDLKLISKFEEGTHSTFSAADDADAFVELMKQTGSFLRTDGKGIEVTP